MMRLKWAFAVCWGVAGVILVWAGGDSLSPVDWYANRRVDISDGEVFPVLGGLVAITGAIGVRCGRLWGVVMVEGCAAMVIAYALLFFVASGFHEMEMSVTNAVAAFGALGLATFLKRRELSASAA